MGKSPNKRTDQLYIKLLNILNLYLDEKDIYTKYSTSDEVKRVRSNLSKDTPQRKADILEELIERIGNRIDADVYPENLIITLIDNINQIKSELGPGRAKKDLDKLLFEKYQNELSWDNGRIDINGLLNIEKKYMSRFQDLRHCFNYDKAVPFAYAAFDSAFYGCGKESRISWLKKNGLKLKNNESIVQYLDPRILLCRVKALEEVNTITNEYFLKKQKLNEGKDKFLKEEKLSQLQFEIYASKVWKIGHRAYCVAQSITKTEPLQSMIDANDQLYIEETKKVKKTKDNRPSKLKSMERDAKKDKIVNKIMKDKYNLVPDKNGGYISSEEEEKRKEKYDGEQTDFFDILLKQGVIDIWDVEDIKNSKKKSKK